ncbi:hypothetical protein AYI83_00240 [Shewanella algae]|uniref:tetratricopeptide repeat protein n=1 Tax=Shewanella algae TaxID=38313 RepID=UPI001182E8AB|nr:tetratricopeptide repeat protein [Shewanella algae]TVL00591.1 hypothetical protein AYI83_00240 [Shewanella algae]
MLDDVAFIASVSEDLAREYRTAKRYVQDVPTQALLHVRSFAHQLTELLAAPAKLSFDSPNLYDRIEQLNRQRLIDVRITRALHRLRADGNRGAHPEKFHLTETQLLQLAKKAIGDLLKLMELAYPRLKGREAPEYHFDDFDLQAGRELCYRAVMEDDAEAQYLLGMALKNRALIARGQEQALQDKADEPLTGDSARMLAKAAHWFAEAAPTEPKALFEHGVALIHGYSGDVDLATGQQAIRQAAEAGVTDAMALLGYFYLVGRGELAKDEIEAERFLSAAAANEQSEAMANLGVLCYQRGELQQAFEHITRAARAGDPHAQYHLALMLARGEGCEADPGASEQWLAEAAEQGQLDAMLARAQHMLNDDTAFGSDLSQAESYLRQVIRYGHSVTAMIELAIALTDGCLGRIDVVEAVAWLRLARERADERELEVIGPLWQSLQQQVENVLQLSQSADERRALKRAQELLAD